MRVFTYIVSLIFVYMVDMKRSLQLSFFFEIKEKIIKTTIKMNNRNAYHKQMSMRWAYFIWSIHFNSISLRQFLFHPTLFGVRMMINNSNQCCSIYYWIAVDTCSAFDLHISFFFHFYSVFRFKFFFPACLVLFCLIRLRANVMECK